MKGFKWLLILFIGMISLTGFSSTTDLTENSIVVLDVDNDVGVIQATLVEIKLVTNEPTFSLAINYQKAFINRNANNVSLEEIYNPKLNRLLAVPWQLKDNNNKLPSYKNFKAPRDSLNSIRA